MNTSFHRIPSLVVFASALLGSLLSTQVAAQPAQKPLLTNQSGALPNLMVALDNSGSMAFPYHEAYYILFNDNNPHNLSYCTGGNQALEPTGSWVVNGMVDFTRPVNQRCANSTRTFWTTDNGTPFAATPVIQNAWTAQRSADLNPVYYDPRTTYAPRVGPDYAPLTRDASVQFVSNQGGYTNAAGFFYRVYRNPLNGDLYTTNVQKPNGMLYRADNDLTQAKTSIQAAPFWANALNDVYSLSVQTPFPTHLEHNATTAATPSFQYAFCRDALGASTVQKDRNNMDVGCSSVRNPPYATSAAGSLTTVLAPGNPAAATNIITLPPDNSRTDCGTAPATQCTNAQEVNNILNWYHWYSTRVLATSTAIGQSLAADNIQNKIRIGYMPINDLTRNTTSSDIRMAQTPGTVTNIPDLVRGVRTLATDTTTPTVDSQRLYRFLNSTVARGGTPLHNAVTQVATYYGVPSGTAENPWSTNPAQPASTGNPEMTCRRSFNLLFSDGSWTQSYAPAAGSDYDNINGPTFSQLQPDGSNKTYRYLRLGDDTVTGRAKYIPYPSTSRGGLADLTAQYFWHTDLRPGLDNFIKTRQGQPTFWQNMTTYTVGYFVQPTAEVTGGAGLSFQRINQYQTQYTTSGYASAVKPVWPTGNLVTGGTTQELVDDFIQAGYTGGGRAFSAKSSDDVRRIFDTIVAEILSSSGTDAGVSVSGGANNSTLSASGKYTVSYQTLDNSGEVSLLELDPATGNETGTVVWRASALIPLPGARRIFSMTGNNTSVPFSGRFDALPTDIRSAIRQGPYAARVPNDASFVNYLRGDNFATDTAGTLFRQRTSLIAAMVNPPSVYMGDGLDYVYDGDASGGVEGRGSYGNYVGRKKATTAVAPLTTAYHPSLFIATNGGMVHALDARNANPATTTAGHEQAAFMPRRSLSHMLNFANEPYSFEYVLDGPISENDVFDRTIAPAAVADEWTAWRHMGIGTGGRGSKLIYALRSPIHPGSNPNRIPNQEDFMWETGADRIDTFNDGDGEDVTLGYIANSARTGQTEDQGSSSEIRGKWIVAVNNGHYNGEPNGEKTGLVVLDALTGEVIRTIPIPVVAGQPPNRGLSGVTLLRDYTTNTRVTAAYAGDANGNLWRFTLLGDPSTWRLTYNEPLFTVPGNRPIFGHPAWQPWSDSSVNEGFMVVFATGMALEESDIEDLGAQSIYAIWDKTDVYGQRIGTAPFPPVTAQESDLQEQNGLASDCTTSLGETFCRITDNPINWSTQRGWRLPLGWYNGQAAGERSIADVQNVGRKVLITTTELHPAASGEMCSISDLPGNFIYVLDVLTGSRSSSRSFDVSAPRDGSLEDYAVAYKPAGGFSRGVSVTLRRTTLDGTLLPTETPTTSTDAGDPYVAVSSERTGVGFEAHGESAIASKNATKCQNTRGTILGTATGSVQFGTECPTTAWTRTQFQLGSPPSN
ncbi:hypothetical protein LPB72_18300 [Hydrogenophaga crassostreae]|uniref:PilY1 beta-propeller domain-containing protein n=1 Tax=Hydrogenophaga crassostreae TaxID=1763535 RepID=A0A167H0U8_9BURK|nr:PilC/PilY family type IV pilus protein [Hydrogenophaga crassostreae]AOW12928.1 hypothetical protein LPB072_08805 [Hydrogenophaga crassostreae]OAD40113.1 hypothetical protein LPB72_18300 [Hydrogenophaga crassostreae]